MTEELELLDEDNTGDFEPTEEDIIEYAQYLGLSPRFDQKYFYIAVEGLKAKLPFPWKPARARDGSIYYYNTQTKSIQEEHPLDALFRNKVIEAKKADSKGVTGKQKKKLHNLVQWSRDNEEEPLMNQSFAVKMSSRQASQRNQVQHTETPKQSNDNLVIDKSKSKLSGNLASKLGASSNDQESLLYENPKISDRKENKQIQTNQQLEIENYEKMKQVELDKFLSKLQVEEIQEQNRSLDLAQDYDSINEKMKQSYLGAIKQREEIKQKLFEESEKIYQQEIFKLENQFQAQKQYLELHLQEENHRQLQNQINQSVTNLSKIRNRIEQLKNQVKAKKENRDKLLLVNRKSIETRFEVQKKFIDNNLEEELRNYQEELEKKNEIDVANFQKQLKNYYNREKQDMELKAQIDDSLMIKQKIRDFYREKFMLTKKIKEQDLQSQLMDEEHNLKANMETQVQKYLRKMKQIYIMSKQADYNQETSEQIKKLNEQLKIYKQQVIKSQDIKLKEIELRKQQELMSTQFQQRSELDQSINTDSIKILSNLKQEFVKLSYDRHTKATLLYDAEQQLKQLMLEHKLSSLKTIMERKSYLKSLFNELQIQIGQLKKIKGSASTKQAKATSKYINSNLSSKNLNQSFDVTHQKISLIDFIEKEKKRIKNYLIELKNQKLQAKEIYHQINQSQENSNLNVFDEQSNQYNTRVELIRKMQEKIQKLEEYLKKITHLLQEYLKYPSQENKIQTEMLREKYENLQDELEQILYKIKKDYTEDFQIVEPNLEISHEVRQSFNKTFYKYQNYESCTQKTRLLLEEQHNWLNSVKKQLDGIQIQRHLRSQSFY